MKGGGEEGGGTHTQTEKKSLEFVYVLIMRVCAPGEAPQMGEVCVGSSGNRITLHIIDPFGGKMTGL